MLTSLLFGAALAAPSAPVPRDAAPAPAGPAPWVVYLKSNPNNGRVILITYKTRKVKQTRTIAENKNGKIVTRLVQEEVTRMISSSRVLDSQSLKLTRIDGTSLDSAQAAARVREGVAVLISADGKPIEKAWLRAFDPATPVLTDEALSDSQLPPFCSARATGKAPRLVLLGTDGDGNVHVTCNPNGTGAGSGPGRMVVINNAAGVQQVFLADNSAAGIGQTSTAYPRKPLEAVKFEAYDLLGKRVPRETALKRLKAGGLVLIAGDNRIPEEEYLKVFQGDLLILVSQELLNIPLNPGTTPAAPVPPGAPVAPLPLGRPVLRIVPGIQAKPLALPAAPAKKAPAKPAAPAEKPAPNGR